jgi:signal transduction histidine kinase
MTWRAVSINPNKQVVLNLLSNAIKFTPGLTAGGEVEVRTEMASETAENNVIKISVRDTGIGRACNRPRVRST